jgi:hypothetical protein
MSSFDEFAEPSLVLHLHGATYVCPPPNVGNSAVVIALHVRARVQLGLDEGPVDQKLLDLIDKEAGAVPLAVLTLGQTVYDQLLAAGESAMTINRMGYYGILYWARGEEYADGMARAMWAQPAEVAATPKAPSRSRSGRPTASDHRTKTASTRTTGSPKASSPTS